MLQGSSHVTELNKVFHVCWRLFGKGVETNHGGLKSSHSLYVVCRFTMRHFLDVNFLKSRVFHSFFRQQPSLSK